MTRPTRRPPLQQAQRASQILIGPITVSGIPWPLSTAWTTADIAKTLGIREGSVKEHINAICNKLGASNRTEAVAIALRTHLLKI